MPTVPIPASVRFGLYLFTAVGSPVVVYLAAKGYIGDVEVALWAAEASIVSAVAASHTSKTADPNA